MVEVNKECVNRQAGLKLNLLVLSLSPFTNYLPNN